jgi:hypothetical protein
MTVLSLVVATAITANVGILFLFGERLARIETKIEIVLAAQSIHIAKTP